MGAKHHGGYAGLLDLGYAGFYALGAYTYALLSTQGGFGFWQALPLSALVAVAAAIILGLPVLRLRGDYFAVVTLGFGEIVRLVVTNWTQFTGGPNGITGITRPTLFASNSPAASAKVTNHSTSFLAFRSMPHNV